jgi:hypothetical protein
MYHFPLVGLTRQKIPSLVGHATTSSRHHRILPALPLQAVKEEEVGELCGDDGKLVGAWRWWAACGRGWGASRWCLPLPPSLRSSLWPDDLAAQEGAGLLAAPLRTTMNCTLQPSKNAASICSCTTTGFPRHRGCYLGACLVARHMSPPP